MRCMFAAAVVLLTTGFVLGQRAERGATSGPDAEFSQILGRPTDHSSVVSVLSAKRLEAYVEFGPVPDKYSDKTPVATINPGVPHEFELAGLKPDSQYAYRIRTREAGAPANAPFASGPACTLRTQRRPGSTFTFALQGDSHPERMGKMFDPDLYVRTMRNVAEDAPDFYLMMGDDFSIERLIERSAVTQPSVDQIYAHQRSYLGIMARSSALFLVNGNHEQAAKYLLDGTPNNPAVCAGKARTKFFPLPAPDAFYTGNSEEVPHIGLLRDYYAWTWGDALFVVIDPYWHSSVPVDNQAGVRAPDQGNRKVDKGGGGGGGEKGGGGGKGGGGKGGGGKDDANADVKRGRDLWQITLGDTQYRWLASTLRGSKAKFKFVFSHHVLGTGRGGVEEAGKFEWGGKDGRGVDRFFQQRPNWEQPIHDLMRDAGVTIFFQGHDHLYARQELDGVTYQSVPNPADSTFTAFNRESYRSGDILPNSGHLRVTVSATEVKVDYVRSFRPADEGEGKKNQSIGHSYTLPPRPIKPVQPAPSRPAERKP